MPSIREARLLNDEQLKLAVSRILQRSERQDDLTKLIGTFVDVGVLPQLQNHNNQIIYGRRGTGKTHVLRVLGPWFEENEHGTVTVYLDARTLGSSAQFSDPDVPIRQRCLALFRDIMTPIHDGLLEYLLEHSVKDVDGAFTAIDEVAAAIVEPVEGVKRETVREANTSERTDSAEGGVELGNAGAKLSAGAEAGSKQQTTNETTYHVTTDDKVVFPRLHKGLKDVLDKAEIRLLLLLDEWSALPQDIQPYLAEFLKRSILPVGRATVKIAALEYRSRFTLRDERGITGFELGADIAAAQDIDDYFVFDRNPELITDAYADILYRHLSASLPDNYLNEKLRISDGRALQSRLFTERETFRELARASEGVIRDLINIFTRAFFDALRRGRDSIDRKAILEASRAWFEQDKAQQLDDRLHTALQRIVDEVIGKKKARSFLLPRELEGHPIVQKLFDARVLHHMQRGYAHKDKPGVRYNIYTLDYGTYVDLLGTSKQPELEMTEKPEDENFAVPFDDKRSIRRIILSEAVFRE